MGASSQRYLGLIRALGVSLAMPVAAVGCAGGSNTPLDTAHEKAAAEPSEGAAQDDAAVEEESAAPRATCDDGTCSPCGAGMCPTGWYCDESSSGGPACSWLPQCAQKSSCSCLASVLASACQCAEQGGGLHVTCR